MYYKKNFSVYRADLYEQIWTQPVVTIAKEYGLSDVGLRKKCKKYKIPLPPHGYWQKKQHGKHVAERPPLPPYEGDDKIEFDSIENDEPEVLNLEEPHVKEGQEKIAFEQLEENKIKVSQSLTSPHPFVIQNQEILNGIKPSGYDGKCLDIAVGQNSINRALRIMDALIKALESRGFVVSITKDNSREHSHYKTCVQVLGKSFEFGLKEHTTRKLKVFTKEELKERAQYSWLRDRVEYVWEHNGNLTLTIKSWRLPYGSRANWSDGKRLKVEDYLNDFIIGLINAAVKMRSDEIKEQKREQERLERECQRAERND